MTIAVMSVVLVHAEKKGGNIYVFRMRMHVPNKFLPSCTCAGREELM